VHRTDQLLAPIAILRNQTQNALGGHESVAAARSMPILENVARPGC
jgi:hypothetical protein